MKKFIFLITPFLILLLFFSVFTTPLVTSKFIRTEPISQLSDVNLSFSVLGDVHGDTVKLEEALRDLHTVKSGMDAMVLNGDIVDQGTKEQYRAIEKCLKENNSLLPKVLIKNIGNHEFYADKKGLNTPADVYNLISRYLAFSGEKAVYHDTWIKGYHFISLGSEVSNTPGLGTAQAFISPYQQQWLKQKLAERYQPNKPIFVFLHQHLSSNNQNAIHGWPGVKQDAEIKKILSQYPEVFLFTSHTHTSLRSVNVTPNQPFTMVHTGAVKYDFILESNGERKIVDDNQGLYIEVHENRVVIKGRDFKSKSWIFSWSSSFI
ncbi:metallophosphoesterase family protein [Desulfitobacterium sp. AusDCA]|uniref:metallophosphoesterase family protein n=1 Tax=Desulfitobacterium sp. AusDCA TaxID=3240383 RepID=UPI003DA70AB4